MEVFLIKQKVDIKWIDAEQLEKVLHVKIYLETFMEYLFQEGLVKEEHWEKSMQYSMLDLIKYLFLVYAWECN